MNFSIQKRGNLNFKKHQSPPPMEPTGTLQTQLLPLHCPISASQLLCEVLEPQRDTLKHIFYNFQLINERRHSNRSQLQFSLVKFNHPVYGQIPGATIDKLSYYNLALRCGMIRRTTTLGHSRLTTRSICLLSIVCMSTQLIKVYSENSR